MPRQLASSGQPAVYNTSPLTLNDGDTTALNVDSSQNLKTTLATSLNKTDDSITSYPKSAVPVNLTASGQILSAPGQIVGFYVNSTSSGTVRIADNTVAGSGYLGNVITPAVGYHAYPAQLLVGGYITITNTIDVTFFVIPA